MVRNIRWGRYFYDSPRYLVAVLEGSLSKIISRWGVREEEYVQKRLWIIVLTYNMQQKLLISVFKRIRVKGRTFALPNIDSRSHSFSFRYQIFAFWLRWVRGLVVGCCSGSTVVFRVVVQIAGCGGWCLINSTIQCSWRKAFWRTVPAARSVSSTTSCRLGYSWPATAPTASGTGADTPALAATKTSDSHTPE